ncbi:hypothetical protein KAU39_03235 [bacterium]|nr:hypothetical protein [bacterium]
MRKNLVIGILKETKAGERRAPLTPTDVEWLIKRGISVEVECSLIRVFKDKEYEKKGAKVLTKFKKATLLLGIKEPQVRDLYKDKIYMIFSHTIKGQPENMPLLNACLEKKITLIDYEKIIDLYGKRLVYFGRFAGICGALNSLYYLGKKLEWKGIDNPFSSLKQACKYSSLKSVKQAVKEVGYQIKTQGFEKELTPFIIGITGHGNVSLGAQEIFDLLNPAEIHPKNILKFVQHQKKIRNKLYKIIFFREEKFRPKNGKGFYFEEYLQNPAKFESNLDVYLPYINMLIHTSYWDRRYPRIITKKMIHKLTGKEPFRLDFVGDISCDINGSIELTRKATTTDNPTFTYDFNRRKYVDSYKSEGITILAQDNLPSELPRDASGEFSSLIREYVYQLAAHGIKDVTNHIALPKEIRGAVISQNGKIQKEFTYLKKYI